MIIQFQQSSTKELELKTQTSIYMYVYILYFLSFFLDTVSTYRKQSQCEVLSFRLNLLVVGFFDIAVFQSTNNNVNNN